MYTYSSKVQHVVDGDTVDLLVDLGFAVGIVQRFRLNGIDAPEMKLNTLEAGKASKAHLESLLASAPGGIIMLVSKGRDKYGRWVADLSYGDLSSGVVVNVNQRMVTDGFAVPYTP